MADLIMDFLNKTAGELQSKQVKVGFIDGATYPDGTSVAQVAAWNEYGQPENNQPPRPFFRNAVSEHENEWSDAVAKGMRAGVPVEHVLEFVGATIANDVYKSIKAIDTPTLSAATIAARRSRGNKSIKPLQDTRLMIGDVNYEVSDIEPSQDSQ